MRSICKNCGHSHVDGERIVCGKSLRYVSAEDTCRKYDMKEGEGDMDRYIFIAFSVALMIATLIGLVFTL